MSHRKSDLGIPCPRKICQSSVSCQRYWPVPCYAPLRELGAWQYQRSSAAMCDYSLHQVKSRPAKVGDKLMTINFRTGTRGFAAPEDSTTAVCILPGTELAF